MTPSDQAARKDEIYGRAVAYLAAALPAALGSSPGSASSPLPAFSASAPVLYGPNGAPILPDSAYTVRSRAARREGSMTNWIPQRLLSRQQEAIEREQIVERSIDLVQNDPHGAGLVDTIATHVIGAGLTPLPILEPTATGLTDEEIQPIRAQQKAIFQTWSPFADAAGRMNFGALQYLWLRNLMQFGEYLVLLPMIDDPTRPYYLACQVINPLRLKTPVDLVNDARIFDGVELGQYGEPVAYWIKKSPPSGLGILADVSDNFVRVPARQGHRWNVLHNFISREPEQVRGAPILKPAMKMFRDFSDLLDAELVSNIVTAAFSLFIKTLPGNNPYDIANKFSFSEDRTDGGGNTKKVYYQEFPPGGVLYGNVGEEMQAIKGDRPGTTFEPFVKTLKKALAMAVNLPYPIAFKDVENVNFAGFRSAMLDAWKVITFYRSHTGQGASQRIYTMLMEEAYLRGELDIPSFYTRMHALTRCDWRGSPKGDIEPVKAEQANALAVQNNTKTREAVIAERDGDLDVVTVFDQLAKEQQMMKERGLTEGPVVDAAQVASESGDTPQDQGANE
jgi:lambda family phage portal protein